LPNDIFKRISKKEKMTNKSFAMSRFFGLLLLTLLAFGAANAQEFRATVTGTVKDPNDAIVPGATVTITNTATNIAATATTNDEGVYTFPLLQPGKYKLSATTQNFQTAAREELQLNVDDRLTVDIILTLGASAEVSVSGNSELIETGSVTTGTLVTTRQIEELPLAEGAPYTLATQAPGVNYTGDPNFQGPTANGGWQIQGVYEWQSGEPLQFGNVYYGGDPSQLVSKLGKKDDQGRRYGVDIAAFDTAGFYINGAAPAFANNFTSGSANTIRSFPFTTGELHNQRFLKFDVGLSKNFRIREGMKFQVRVEAINLLNSPYFSAPILDPTNVNFGYTVAPTRQPPRDIQIGRKFTFQGTRKK
jgi:Carboxypeptidase regulatory-like domain